MDAQSLPVHIVIDASNLLHQAQTAVPELLRLKNTTYARLAIHYPSLVKCILAGRQQLGAAVLVTSTPSDHVNSWKALPEEKFRRINFPRQKCGGDGGHREKGNDVAVALEAILPNCEGRQQKSILALVAGDGDYTHLASVMIDRGWHVEVHFWESELCGAWRCMEYILSEPPHPPPHPAEVAIRLKQHAGPMLKIMPTLSDTFKNFAYMYSAGEGCTRYSLHVTYPKAATLRHDEWFHMASTWGSFVRMTILDDDADDSKGHMYFHFCDEGDMTRAEENLKDRQPDLELDPWTYTPKRARSESASDSRGGGPVTRARRS